MINIWEQKNKTWNWMKIISFCKYFFLFDPDKKINKNKKIVFLIL